MLASEQQKQHESDIALAKAAETLAEARQTVANFRKRNAELLKMRHAAQAITEIIRSSGKAISDLTPTRLMESAEAELTKAIEAHEQGKLNQERMHADQAGGGYRQILDKTLPWLTELTAVIIEKAAHTNAKRYTPKIYQAAKDKLAELENYIEGRTSTLPEHPENGLYLAREARHMAEQVKAWRKKSSSHESIVLKNRALKLQLANALGISKTNDIMLTDIPDNDLLRAVEKLNRQLTDERTAHQQDMSRLASEYKQQLQSKTEEIEHAQQGHLSEIRAAFKAKLERETFEKNRQQQLRKLFKHDDVEILANLDGSLLIRLKALKFRSGRSKIEPKYFDLLGQLRQAMDIYQERHLSIEGHTDNRGDVKANQRLSLKRAEAVRDFLISAGAKATRLKALGYGEVRPIASNEFKQGRAMNRRIDIVIKPNAASK